MSRPIDEYTEETQRCIRCGLCQTVCPVYAETKEEQSVARGKLRLAAALMKGDVEVTPRMKEIMSLCLSCGACVSNCPATVKTDKVVLATRAYATEKDGLPLPMNFVLRQLLTNPSLQALACSAGAFVSVDRSAGAAAQKRRHQGGFVRYGRKGRHYAGIRRSDFPQYAGRPSAGKRTENTKSLIFSAA